MLPLSSQDFLEHPVLSQTFEKKIIDAAVEDLGVESADGQEIPVSLNQVFPDLAGELGSREDLGLKKKSGQRFWTWNIFVSLWLEMDFVLRMSSPTS